MRRLAPSLALALIFGCSDPSPVDDRFEGELTDDDEMVAGDRSRYDDYAFEAGERWTITVDMESDELDSWLWLIGPNADGDLVSLVQNDDAGEGLNARISWETRRAGRYIVRANGRREADRGHYTLHVIATPGAEQ